MPSSRSDHSVEKTSCWVMGCKLAIFGPVEHLPETTATTVQVLCDLLRPTSELQVVVLVATKVLEGIVLVIDQVDPRARCMRVSPAHSKISHSTLHSEDSLSTEVAQFSATGVRLLRRDRFALVQLQLLDAVAQGVNLRGERLQRGHDIASSRNCVHTASQQGGINPSSAATLTQYV